MLHEQLNKILVYEQTLVSGMKHPTEVYSSEDHISEMYIWSPYLVRCTYQYI